MGLNKLKKAKANDDYPDKVELQTAFKDGFDYYEDAKDEERRKFKVSFWITSATVIVLSIVIGILKYSNVPNVYILIFSILTIVGIVWNGYVATKFLGNSWAILISFGAGFLILFLCRGDVTFEQISEMWKTKINTEFSIK